MGHYVLIIGPLYLAISILFAVQILRYLAFVFPGLRREPRPEKIAAAQKKGAKALKRAAEPRVKTPFAVIFIILFVGASNLMPLGYFFPAGALQKILRRAGYFMTTLLLYLFIAFLLYALVGLVLVLFRKLTLDGMARGTFFRVGFGLALLAALGMVVYGEVNARIIRVTRCSFQVDKDGGNIPLSEDGTKRLRVALIGDLHLGYNMGLAMTKDMVEKINRENVDLVFVAGDIFDNAYDAIEKPDEISAALAGLQSKYGTYAVFGNHDVEDNLIFGFNFHQGDLENDPRYIEFLANANMTLLRDEVLPLFDGSVYLVGRRDEEETGLLKSVGEERAGAASLAESLDKSKILIDLEHEPKEVAEVCAAGFDMQLCGHTHNGQFFPLNCFIGFGYFNAYGYKVYDGSLHTVTTCGVGSYGPFNRALVDPEVCILDIAFR